jgi:SAM-dependent methyltransferase
VTPAPNAAEETRQFWEGRTAVEGPRATRFHGGHDDYDLPAIRALCPPGASVLDLGCGTCVVANELVNSTQAIVHAVDYVPAFLAQAEDHPRLTTAHGDVRTYLDPQRHDLILLLGVVTYLDDPAERRDLYRRCAAMLAPGGTLFVKAQFGVREEVVIDTESEALGSRYHAVYPWLAAEVALLSECFDVEVRDPYPAEFNTYDNTHFHHLVATLRDAPAGVVELGPAAVATIDLRRADQEASRDLLIDNLRQLHDALADTPIAGRTWIFGGLDLGLVREGEIMLHDTKDVDFAYLGEDAERLEASFPALIEAGFDPHFRFPGLTGEATEHSFTKDGAKFEFFRLDLVGDEFVFHHYGQTPERSLRNRCTIPAQPLKELRLAGRTWLHARDSDVELTALYGDWRTPNPDWNYLEGPSIVETTAWDDATFNLWGEHYRAEAPAPTPPVATAPPKASVVLTVCNQFAHTLHSLQALAELGEAPTFEVVIVDDGSTDATPHLLGGLEGDVRVLRNATSAGFGAACDQAAAVATGEQLVFLDAAALPVSGWLEALSAALDAKPTPAAALPQSVRPDGGLQSPSQWLALAVRRSAFEAVGGFASTARHGRSEKGSLLDALAGTGGADLARSTAVLLVADELVA